MIGHYACRRKRGIIASHGIPCNGISSGLVRCGYAPRLGKADLKPFEIDAIVNGPTAGEDREPGRPDSAEVARRGWLGSRACR